jgi:acyl-coenzyme A synthetase/AMP-(fatty) acid ligase
VLQAAIAGQRVTHAIMGPAVLAGLDPRGLPGLACLVVAGEACPEQLAARWAVGRWMINAYGPTEATVCVTMSGPLPGDGVPPIGRPIRNTHAYVLDGQLRPVPAGVEGELYVAGPGLARGYLNQPELTAERFLDNPFGPAGSRMYRTGDVVRWNARAELEFVGRSDNQIKIRGYRVEPGEIEMTLQVCPPVRQAVVTAHEVRPGDRRLVAYVVLNPGHAPHVPTLREQLRASLPRHMMPWRFVFLDQLPLTHSGKVDRKALPPPAFEYDEKPAIPARSALEQLLCELFAEALGVPMVGIHDDFFHSGGDSLMATRLIQRIREAGLPVTAPMFFRGPTVLAIAEMLGDEGTSRAEGST